jgi:hypothetical protein
MKKLTFILVILLLLSIHSKGQFSFQVNAGVSVVDRVWVKLPKNIPMDYFEKLKPRLSYLSGLSVQLDLENIYFKSGLIYHNRGSIDIIRYLTPVQNGTNQFVEEKQPLHLHYLGVPFLIGKRIVNKLSVEVGPEINYLIAKDNYPDFDLGLQAGLVYDLFKKLDAKINYYHGLSNTLSLIIDGPPSLQNRMVALSVGYKL